ncbi:MAG: TIGR03013 family PEP-CTERM/XrtA system glycosyltransferase [Sedimenticola sp.]|uniref:TIGR03013 family PEP-CTERM/XrtA system glycosyltransferase n=1 Tax=Sedimenticola thiotaurini TaxID=1543721 RepID=A0A558D522_9GAMM|nr:TIGR03013 family PEP-CTERM/XrtA system glycosyltransferase [Sedimenticola sp.]TVT56115.1 MAG: TIGR03013 family PEP-CTERM/XrtA system glycosyltransferase [Sedimenticola thiotaurini]MCW8921008.1 TIGR03013 family PEP-CTERM/XrtA system glycosyltransferase [Sedimenticola sp.]MCW8947412.1 TIGR03013 family PEP-CTERM/XrtA system glycosyltransferase [Sedimenticola sp.]MCW8949193.1 TIGR03013 family PEP-CTERM/XrtA system glycosyltransferase [Sedimenticola sp.]
MSAHGSPHISLVRFEKSSEQSSATADSPVESVHDNMSVFSRFHSVRGKVQLFGHFFHAQFLLLACVELFSFACAFIYVLPLLLAPSDVSATNPVITYHWTNGAFAGLILILAIASMGLYDTRQREGIKGVLVRLFVAFLSGFAILALTNSFIPILAKDNFQIAQFVLIAFGYSILLRTYFYKFVDGNVLQRRVLVIGAGKRAASIDKLRRKTDQRGFDLVGFVRTSSDEVVQVRKEKIVNADDDIRTFAMQNHIDEIVIAPDDRRRKLPLDGLIDCRMSGVAITDLLDFFERETEKIRLDLIQPSWLIYANGFKRNILRSFAKRTFDIVVSSLLLIVCSPFMALTALAIFISSKGRGPILYKQSRVGRNGKCFNLIKFRSMRTDAEQDGIARWAKENDSRVTRVGSFIRKYRLDELPQLWNIFVNDMSLVGPRPERPEFVEKLCKINTLYRERHRVTPGLAGWAQVCYPYGASKKDSMEKLQYDLYYVKNHGLLFDFYILVQTAEIIFFTKGVR